MHFAPGVTCSRCLNSCFFVIDFQRETESLVLRLTGKKMHLDELKIKSYEVSQKKEEHKTDVKLIIAACIASAELNLKS